MKIKAAINGFGRIGRACARLILASDAFELIAVNDIADHETLRYLFSHDSVYGGSSAGSIADLGGVRFSQAATPSECDFGGADAVLECSGIFLSRAACNSYLERGAKRVVLSAVPHDDIAVIAPTCHSDEPIVSAGSCTTNALWLITNALDKTLGVEALIATSIHSYTSDQRLLDAKHKDRRRGRASAINIIPVETNAAVNLRRIDPRYAHNAKAIGLRVPTPNVSLMQTTLKLRQNASAEMINEILIAASRKCGKNVFETTREPKVLADIIGSYASAEVDLSLTMSLGSLAMVSAWHDNELGFAARMIDLALETPQIRS